MVITKELSNAAVEVNSLLDNVSENVLSKIPSKFIQYLKDIESYDYYFEYNPLKSLEEQGFSEEALKLIGLIYKDYLCDEEEKNEYVNLLKDYSFKKEEEKKNKYNTEELFKNKKKEEIKIEKSQALIEYKESIFTKILNKIKKFFH